MNNRSHIIYIAVIVLLIVGSFIKFDAFKNNISDKEFELDYLKVRTEYFETKSGKQAARIETLQGSVENMEQVLGDSLKVLTDELDIKTKKIKDLVNTSTQTEVSFSAEKDSTGRALQYNRWFDLNIDCSKGLVTGKFIVRDSLTFVSYNKGKWYQKKTLVMDGISHNPSTQITGISNIQIKDSPNKWAMVGGVGLTYYQGRVRLFPTITIGRKIIER